MNNLEKLKKVKDKISDYVLKTPSSLIDEWIDEIKGDAKNPLTTGFKTVDSILKNRLRGKVIAKIGYGGTRKSLAALQGAISNKYTNLHGAYSTMEMSSVNLLERIIDMSLNVNDRNISASEYYEESIKNGYDKLVKEELKKALDDIFGDKLQITQKSRMTAEDYRKLIKRYNNSSPEKLSYLVVDGLSMMGGKGTETDLYTTNSGELKDLAKEFNIYIDLICHCSKTSGGVAGKLHTRDNSRFVRGSEKIIDNVDAYMMFSLIQDPYNPDTYLESQGYYKFVNKRGKGAAVSKVYSFNATNLLMEETEIDPLTVEINANENNKRL